ncbi:MAG: hypothetical protein ACI840_001090 [Ulvibacter sp.]|jgi:hypothetical protein
MSKLTKKNGKGQSLTNPYEVESNYPINISLY